jgi:arabinose-5-phosphate isomerase
MAAPKAKGKPDPHLAYAREVLAVESAAVAAVAEHLGEELCEAIEAILGCAGRVVVTGLGKPGFVAQKLSATLASTGTPSLYLHPAEAAHGDLGRVLAGDVVLALSHSGETEEILRLLPALKAIDVQVIAMTGAPQSGLARAADITLSIGPISEACPLGLAPTASSIALLALADALAMAVLKARPFTPEEYARLHPGGALGKKLMKVAEIMRAGDANPLVAATAPISEALAVMTRTPGRPGATNVIRDDGVLVGIFTDGDLRRLIEGGDPDLSRPVEAVMGRRPRTAQPDQLVSEAAELLRDAKIDQLPVVDEAGRPVGLLDVQDLLAARLV